MRIIEALELLEEAFCRCKQRSIDTSRVREALDVLHSYARRSRPKIEAFRNSLQPMGAGEVWLEMQQRELATCFPSIHNEVRTKLEAHIRTLEFRYKTKPDDKLKAEIERLKFELEGLPEDCQFIPW